MPQLAKGILGVSAVALTFGAVQFASGRDLPSAQPNYQQGSSASEAAINRVAKADRAARVAAPAIPTQTISLRLDGLSATSFLVRVPLQQEARNNSPAPAVTRSGGRKPAVACEPVVSVLTEVAKQLQPGRCIT
jgi:hypothetical protein